MPSSPAVVPPPPAGLAAVVSLGFRALSAARGSRIFHPQGFCCGGTWTIEQRTRLSGDAPALQPGARFDVEARVSRGAGLPEAIGDIYGIAVRVRDAGGPGRDQDVLANASLDLPLVHHVFLPAPHWYAQAYSTCLPYDAGAGQVVLGWLPPAGRTVGPGLDAMRGEVRGGHATFGIGIARAPLGRFTRVGTLRLDRLLPATDLSFDPVAHTGGGLEPTGLLNRLRGPAYRASQRGRTLR